MLAHPNWIIKYWKILPDRTSLYFCGAMRAWSKQHKSMILFLFTYRNAPKYCCWRPPQTNRSCSTLTWRRQQGNAQAKTTSHCFCVHKKGVLIVFEGNKTSIRHLNVSFSIGGFCCVAGPSHRACWIEQIWKFYFKISIPVLLDLHNNVTASIKDGMERRLFSRCKYHLIGALLAFTGQVQLSWDPAERFVLPRSSDT